MTFELSATTVTSGSLWVLGVVPNVETPVLEGLWNSVQPAAASFNTPIVSAQTASGGSYAGDETGVLVPPGQTRTLWFRFMLPKSTSGALSQTLRLKVNEGYP